MRKTPRTAPRIAWVLVGVIAAVAAVGAGIAVLPGDRGIALEETAPAVPAPEQQAAQPMPHVHGGQFRAYFTDGVEYLRQGRAHEALVSFNAASHLHPHVPELFANIGFAQVALGKHKDAAKAFEQALEINASQANAYYGLAVALEAMQRLEEALGAMRTYEHLLPKEETKFRRLATAAIWEWEFALKVQRGEMPPPPETPDETPTRSPDATTEPHGHGHGR